MFYVYHGYVSPDNCDASDGPCYEIATLESAEAVAAFYREFQECLHDETSNPIFRVFQGEERRMVATKTVTEWGLA